MFNPKTSQKKQIRKCNLCLSDFIFRSCPSDVSSGRGKFCSNHCKEQSRWKLPKEFKCETCSRLFSNKFGKVRRFCSHKCYSKTLIGKSPANKGREMPITSMKMMGNTNSPRGENHHDWRGGVTPIHIKIRKSKIYLRWRNKVFEHDNYACIWCGAREKLHADHIKPFAYFPELRFELSNGRTLCEPCHKTTDTYGRKAMLQFKQLV